MAAGQDDQELNEAMKREPTKVGKKLTELTTRRLIILVILMLIVLPFLDGSIFQEDTDTYKDFGLDVLHHMPQDLNVSACASGACLSGIFFKDIFQGYVANAGKLLFISVCETNCRTTFSNAQLTSWANQVPANSVTGWVPNSLRTENYINTYYRASEAQIVEITGCFSQSPTVPIKGQGNPTCVSRAYFDLKTKTQLEAGLSIVKTFFVMVLLTAGSIMFTRDATRLVIEPIERMVGVVNSLAQDPLSQGRSKKRPDGASEELESEGNYETALLEKTLAKIGGLLQVGFGEAGAEIIGKNMKAGGALNPMIPGKKVYAIFGFCDIRQFTDTTECLQEEVMVYVNKIGEIVHSCTHMYFGAANKNIGDAFLLAWKVGDYGDESVEPVWTDQLCDARDKFGNIRKITVAEMCDSALTAFLKIIIELDNANHDTSTRHGRLADYHKHPAVIDRFGDGFQIKMGFGMHIGWAIEGAIGSSYKIDASYLSPNVNMAARLEAATKQFRTPLLLSHWFVEQLSEEARALCRKIDRVTVKGSLEPMTLYTYDITDIPEAFMDPRYDRTKNFKRVPVSFGRDTSYRRLQRSVPAGFYEAFGNAMNHYLDVDGDWDLAKAELDRSLELKPNDGPAVSLRIVMESYDFVKPEGWKGYRELTEK